MKRILVAVDGTQKGLEAVSILGRLLRDQEELQLVLLHCVQQVAALLPGELCVELEDQCKFNARDQEKVGNLVLGESARRLTDAGFPSGRLEMKMVPDSLDPAKDILGFAEKEGFQTIAMGRRGRSQIENLLLGSTTGKVAQYAIGKSVWIVDSPVNETRRALVAMDGTAETGKLLSHTATHIASCAAFNFTLLHIMPPVPPTFWDNGHILDDLEQKGRQSRIEKWKSDWRDKVEKFMSEGRELLKEKGVGEQNMETMILPSKEGVARDILNEIREHQFHVVVIGKKSFHERKPFLMGSHAAKILHTAQATVLCLVD